MSTLRNVLYFAIPAVAAGALWFGHSTQSASAADRSTIVRPAVLVAPGRVETVRDPVALAFETGGRIISIDVDEGQAVKAGQIVARLDDRLAAARVASARAAVAGANANYLLARRGTRAEDLAAAKAELDAAQANADHSAAEHERSEKLGTAGAISSSSVDADSATARVTAAQAAAAQARYAALVKGTRSEQVAAAAASLDAAKAELAAAETMLDQTVLRAPHDGVVLRRLAEVGTLVTTVNPETIVTVADLRQLEIRTELDEADVAAVSVGMPAYATADAFGDRHFPVRISRITNELGRKQIQNDDPRARVDTRVLEVIAQFDPSRAPNESLPLGLRMYVHVER